MLYIYFTVVIPGTQMKFANSHTLQHSCLNSCYDCNLIIKLFTKIRYFKILIQELESDNTSDLLLTPNMTKSPALAAEKVIQANMTDEQRKLEFE